MTARIFSLFRTLVALGLFSLATAVSAADNYLGIDNKDLREGNVGFEDIPTSILAVTNFLLGLTGSIAVTCIIYGAVRMSIGATTGDKESGKKLIKGAIVGFVISLFSWVIINAVIVNL